MNLVLLKSFLWALSWGRHSAGLELPTTCTVGAMFVVNQERVILDRAMFLDETRSVLLAVCEGKWAVYEIKAELGITPAKEKP